MKGRKILVVMLILVTMVFTNTPSSFAEETLTIVEFYVREVNIKTFEPFEVHLDISNPDSVEHTYRVIIDFADYFLSENGVISAGGREQIWMYLIPISYGNQSIEVSLYQDSVVTAPVDGKTKNIVVEKGYQWTQLEDLNEKVENLESEILRLNDVNIQFTYNTIFLAILVLAMGLVFWWRIRNQSKSITV